MLHRSPRALLIWAAAIAVLLATARIVGGDLAEIHRQATSLGPRVDVVVAASDLPLGSTIEPDDVDSVTRHESQVPEAAVREIDDVVGRIVVVPLVADATLLSAHVAGSERNATDAVVPNGMRAMRVPLDVAVRPSTGDVVDVIATFDPAFAIDASDATSIVAAAATVLSVETDDGADISVSGAAVTVLVTEQESEQVAFALAHGVVTLAVAPPEEACCAGD